MAFLDGSKMTIKQVMDILSIRTDTEHMPGVKKAQEYYIRLAEEMGFEVRQCAEDKNGDKRVVEVRPKGSFGKRAKLGIVVHLDTVPAGEDWSHDPYGEIDEGRVYGRGIIDDKGPAVEVLQVLYMMKNYISPDWVIICGSSEETEWVDMEAYMQEKRETKEELPEFSITVDGDGVQNGCRGYLDLKLTFPMQGASERISKFETPESAANNSVPGNATAVVDGQEVEGVGKACHSSIPQNGINALIELAKRILKEHPEAYEEYKDFFDLMRKMEESYDAADTLFFKRKPSTMQGQDVGYTSACPTTCKLEDGKMVVNINIRLMAGTTMEEVTEAIERICETYHCQAEIEELNLPAFIPMDNPSIKRLLEAYEEELGKATQSEIARGVGYNAALPNCAIFGPRWAVEHDEEDTCHSADESRTITDIVKFMNMLVRYLKKEIPLPDLERVNEELIKMQQDEGMREKIKSESREYTPTEVNMMVEMLTNPEFKVPKGLEKEKEVIDSIKEFDQEGQLLTLTPEQLSFVVNEVLVSHKLCDTSLSLEQFVKLSIVTPLLMARYNDEPQKAQGLLKGDEIDEKTFLLFLRQRAFKSEEIEQIRGRIKPPNTPTISEEDYGRMDD